MNNAKLKRQSLRANIHIITSTITMLQKVMFTACLGAGNLVVMLYRVEVAALVLRLARRLARLSWAKMIKA